MLSHLSHRDDGGSRESICLADLVKRAHLPAFTNLLPVQGDHKTFDFDVCLRSYDRIRFVNRLARSCDILDDYNAITVDKLATEQDTSIAMVFCFFSIRAVTNLLAVKFRDAHGGDNGKRNALVGRTENHIEIKPEYIIDGTCVIEAKTMKLISRYVGASVHEER